MAFTPVSTRLKLAVEPGTGLELILRTGSTPKKNLSVSENKTFATKGSQTKRSIAILLGTMNVSVSDYCMTSFVFPKNRSIYGQIRIFLQPIRAGLTFE